MNLQEAISYVEENLEGISISEESMVIYNLADLIIASYNQGWTEGREDYREEQDPTEEQEWRKSR